jgi:hypothetical protein
VAIVLGLAFLNRSEPPIERQATGLAGLVSWLKANDIDARFFKGQQPLVRDATSVRILPLYDTDLQNARDVPRTREEVIAQTSEYDLPQFVFTAKTDGLPTLVVLPKWRSGVRALGMAHKDLLIPPVEMNRLLGQIRIADARVRTDPEGLVRETVDFRGEPYEIALMHPQTIDAGSTCAPLIGTRDRMLLGDCGKKGEFTYRLLTDPDLLSNHGLALSGNARLVLDILRDYDLAATTIVDMSDRVWLVDRDPFTAHYERSWDDFTRMFAWPFTMIWIGFFAVGALVLWRAIVRYGPLMRVYDDEPQAAKTVSIAAKARLLRLANHDEALLKSHIRARLNNLVADLLGTHRKPGTDPVAALLPMIRRSDPVLADEFAAASDISGPIGDIMGRLDRFEDCHDRIRNEFGRTAEPRGRAA